jgi:hypothetical protein
MHTIYPSVFKKPELVNELRRLHANFVLVPADKASNNIVFICKNYYYKCLLRGNEPPPNPPNPSIKKPDPEQIERI